MIIRSCGLGMKIWSLPEKTWYPEWDEVTIIGCKEGAATQNLSRIEHLHLTCVVGFHKNRLKYDGVRWYWEYEKIYF